MLEARTAIKDVCTLKCCHVTVTTSLHYAMHTRQELLINQHKSTAGWDCCKDFFFRFNSLDVFAQSVFQDPQWHNSGISVTSHLFMLNVEYCQSVTGVGQALFWALPVDGKREKAGVGKPKWYQTWYGIPCGRQADNGEWEAALVLINTEHKALRCSLRHFARPLSGTCSVLPSLSRAENSALQLEHGGCFFPDETLLVDRYYNTDGNRPSKKKWKEKETKNSKKRGHHAEDATLMVKQTGKQGRTGEKNFLSVSYLFGSLCSSDSFIFPLPSLSIEWKRNIGVYSHIITYFREACCWWKRYITKCFDWLGNGGEQNMNSFVWMYKGKWIGTTSSFYSKRVKKHEPTTPNSAFPFLYFFGSFAILFTTQEYTHQSPGGASWMRAEIQCTHYAVKSIVSHCSFPWVAFVLFKCLHGTAWGLEDRCMVQEYRFSTIPLFPGWK